MINLEYRKGRPCPHNEITCQEGYCSCCEIYLVKSSSISPSMPEHISLQVEKNLKEFVEIMGHEKLLV